MEEQNQEVQQQSPEDNGSNKMMIMGVGLLGVVIIAAGAFFLMRSQSDSDEMSDTSMQEDVMVEDEMMEDSEAMPASDSGVDEMMVDEENMESDEEKMMEGDVREITVSGFSFGYNPETLTMKAGEKISLTFVSEDAMHDFIIEGTDIATEVIRGGSETTIEFTAPEEPGEYTFYCSVGNHRANGMEGILTVE